MSIKEIGTIIVFRIEGQQDTEKLTSILAMNGYIVTVKKPERKIGAQIYIASVYMEPFDN